MRPSLTSTVQLFYVCTPCTKRGRYRTHRPEDLTRYSTTIQVRNGRPEITHEYVCKQCSPSGSRARILLGMKGRRVRPTQQPEGPAGLTILAGEKFDE